MSTPDRSPDVDELVARFLPALRSFVRLRMGRELRAREESCDLVQSVAREVLENADRFRHGGDAGFREWMFTTAHRKVVNRLERWRTAKRSAVRETHVELPDELSGSGRTPSQQASAREELASLESACDRLTDEQRDVVMMSRLLGLSHAEIGERIGKSEVTVRKILSRALARLTAILAGVADVDP
jgi:RNA polymerase sigma-70 factor (ECF subfamily)